MANTESETAPDLTSTTSAPSRHDRLLDEAARQFNTRGVLLTSLSEIAAKLGLSRKAMYYYVADRQDLVFQCYERAAQITARRLFEASRAHGGAAEVLKDFVTRMLDPNEPEIAAGSEIAMMNPTQRDTIQGLYGALAARLARLLESGHSEGAFRACDVDVIARAILSLVAWAPLGGRWIQALGPLGHSRLLAAAIATLMEGLSPQTRIPEFRPLDLAPLAPRTVRAFDREAALEAKRATLLRIASRLFNRKGIDATSLEEIAAQVGATKRTIHHHIGSKAELVMACYERTYRIFFFIMERALEYPGSRLDALVAAMHASALAYPSEELSPLSPLVGYATLSREGQLKMNEYGQKISTEYRALIRQGVREGSIRDVDVEARALLLPGLTSWLVKDDVPSEPAEQRHIAREIVNLVAVGLGNSAPVRV